MYPPLWQAQCTHTALSRINGGNHRLVAVAIYVYLDCTIGLSGHHPQLNFNKDLHLSRKHIDDNKARTQKSQTILTLLQGELAMYFTSGVEESKYITLILNPHLAPFHGNIVREIFTITWSCVSLHYSATFPTFLLQFYGWYVGGIAMPILQ